MMRFVSRLAVVGLVAMMVSSSVASAVDYPFVLDPVMSSVSFRVKHRDISYVLGRFNKLSGEIVANHPTKPDAFEFKVTVPVKGLDTNNKKRDAHLRGKEFFNARKKPEILFRSTQTKKITGERFEVTGELTLNGVTKPLTLEVDVGGPKKIKSLVYRLGIHTTFTIKRSEFGLGDVFEDVSDEVVITVDLQGEYVRSPVG